MGEKETIEEIYSTGSGEASGPSKHTTGIYTKEDVYPIYEEFEPAFGGLTQQQASELENKLKQDYKIEDFNDGFSEFLGYKIANLKTNEVYIFSPNSRFTLEDRYLGRDRKKELMENGLDLFTRVAVNIASADLKYDPNADVEEQARIFLQMMLRKEFMPNTPTLGNAGKSLQQLSACFVLPVDDYMATDDVGEDPEKQGNGIFDALRYMTMVHKSGGGTGFNFSRLRPKYDRITTTPGSSSGPIPFIKSFDESTNSINQGGFRRGANMGILEYWHPDIFEFIHEKIRGGLSNFNLSVGVDSEFMEKALKGEYFLIINPRNQRKVPLEERIFKSYDLMREERYEEKIKNNDRDIPSLILSKNNKDVFNSYTGQVVGKIGEKEEVLIRADMLLNDIVECAWKIGDPGIIFLDKINEDNPTPYIGKIESTNPCGEQPLLPYEACNLGSINLEKCIKDNEIDYERLEFLTREGVHFLDNVIDKNKFPFKKIYYMAKGNRKIGLGIMGFGNLLYRLKIPYDSTEVLELGKKLMKFITEVARDESEKMGKRRGLFPNWKGSVYDPESKYCKEDKKGRMVRNATVTTIAPTGTISMIADASSGIEPLFSLYFDKACGTMGVLKYKCEEFEKEIEKRGLDLESILKKIKIKGGSIQDLDLPDDIKKVFKTALDIDPKWHIAVQIAFQEYTDNAVSKTINLPYEISREDVKNIYIEAWKSGCKGITIYRDRSRPSQVLVAEKPVINVSKLKFAKIRYPRERIATAVRKEFDVIPLIPTKEREKPSVFLTKGYYKGTRINEMFIIQGKSGASEHAYTEGTGKQVSLGLQHGVPPQAYIKSLKGIKSNTTLLEKNEKGEVIAEYTSIADMIAHELIGEVKNLGEPMSLAEIIDFEHYTKCVFPKQRHSQSETIEYNFSSGPSMYATVAENDSKIPNQYFLERGKSGADENARTETLGRLVSINSQHAVSPLVLFNSLVDIQSEEVSYPGGRICRSMEEAIAWTIHDAWKKRGIDIFGFFDEEGLKGLGKEIIKPKMMPCPNCGEKEYRVIMDGSRNCGYYTCCGSYIGPCH